MGELSHWHREIPSSLKEIYLFIAQESPEITELYTVTFLGRESTIRLFLEGSCEVWQVELMVAKASGFTGSGIQNTVPNPFLKTSLKPL